MLQEDPAAIRAEIDAAIRGRTLCDLMAENVARDGGRPALHWRSRGRWHALSWQQYQERAAEVAMALVELGVQHGDVVAIMASNRPEHAIADLGALHAGATPVTLYSTLAPDQIRYVAGDCRAKVAVLEDRSVLERWRPILADLPDLEYVVLMEGDGEQEGRILDWHDVLDLGGSALASRRETFEARLRGVDPEDPATLIYTSGTTGPPKGVIITHRNILWMLEATARVHPPTRGATAVSYLPLAHIAERMFTHYLGLMTAGAVYFCPDTREALDYVKQARPEAFLAVPRVWEKMHSALAARLHGASGLKGRLVQTALATGRRMSSYRQSGQTPPGALRTRHRLMERLVLSKIRRQIGLDRCDFAVSGAAPISVDVLEFFAALGIVIHEVYGMTETTAVITANRPGHVRLGTVGQPLPGVEVKIAEDGEVLARGPNVTLGYLNRPEATAETYGADGWLHTGDLGFLNSDGYLEITGRKKDLLITSGGKNIAPAEIERLLKRHPLVGQVCVVGEGRPYVSALIVLDHELAVRWARERGVAVSDPRALASHPDLLAEIQGVVDESNTHLSRIEQVKRFRVLPVEWTPETEELTPTLKLKRHVIAQRYRGEIVALYEGPAPTPPA